MDFAHWLFHLLLILVTAVYSQRIGPTYNVNRFQRPLQVTTTAKPNENVLAGQQYLTNYWNSLADTGLVSQNIANWMLNFLPQTALPGITPDLLRLNNGSIKNLPSFDNNFPFGRPETTSFSPVIEFNITTASPPTTARATKLTSTTTKTTTTETPIFLPKGLQKLSWARNLNNSAIMIPPEKYPNGFDPKREYYLGFGNPDFRYQVCSTYTGGNGRCRYLQFCANEDYLQSLDAFLVDACLIGQDFMGVCCMENSGIRDAPAIPPGDPESPTSTPTTGNQTPPKPISKPVNRPSCGLQQIDATRVVGGQLAQEGEWPWMASIIRYKTRHICGGTLITDQHVLTASHCFASQLGDLAANITVRLGEHEFRKKSNNEREFEVKAIYMPEEFSMKTLKNDIAIVHLAEKVNFTDYIQPLCLPPSNVILNGQSAYVAGWGSLTYGGQISPVLMKALLPIWDQIDCQKAYTRLFISSSQMCAGYKEGGQDTCQGDSGGPLMYRTSGGRWSLVGIVSFGRGCGEQKAPGVYTRITSYLDWIKATVLQSTD